MQDAPPDHAQAARRYPAKPADVYLFATCLVDQFDPEAGLDAVRLLEREGIRVHFPQEQTCCGQPAYTSGYTAEARQVAAAQLELFPLDQPIVIPSGSCGGMMVHHWPLLFADDAALHAKAQAVAARVVEFSHFARDVLGLPELAAASRAAQAQRPVKVALHTSCSARREMGVHLPSRALLAALPGVEVVQQAREAECCGFGGTFSARHPAISGAMVADKLASVRDAGAEVLVSADCGCLLNLHHAAQKAGGCEAGQPRCVHLGSFLRERLGLPGAAQHVTD